MITQEQYQALLNFAVNHLLAVGSVAVQDIDEETIEEEAFGRSAGAELGEKEGNVWEIDADVFIINVGHGIGDTAKAVVSLVSGGEAGSGTLV